jgi:hypothetical protein
MRSNYLLPHFLKRVGWIVFVPSLVLGLLVLYADFEIAGFEVAGRLGIPGIGKNNLTDELASICFMASLFLIAFTEEKVEDEWVMKVRLDSLQWAVYVNYGLLAVAILVVYEMRFLDVMVYNMYTILIFFTLRFNYMIHIAYHPNRNTHAK